MAEKKTLNDFLEKNGLDAMLISNEANIRYLTSYSGFSPLERDAHLLITAESIYLFTSPLYSAEVGKLKNITLVQSTNDSPFFKNLLAIVEKEKLENIGFENDSITVAEYLRLTAQISSHFIAKDFSLLRIKKSSQEIEHIKTACAIGDKTFTYIQKYLKPGITEIGVAWEMEKYIRELGGELAFPTIVAFAKNSAVPHHKINEQKLKSDDIVLLDFGVKVDGYCSDMSRTIFIGEPTKEQDKVYAAVKSAQQEAVKLIEQTLKSSKKIEALEIDKIARESLIQKGYPSLPHSLGHGIGIQVHESPRLSPTSKDMLGEGMVFSIEPGIYLEGKFGVRIEDLYTISNNKLIQLTHSQI